MVKSISRTVFLCSQTGLLRIFFWDTNNWFKVEVFLLLIVLGTRLIQHSVSSTQLFTSNPQNYLWETKLRLKYLVTYRKKHFTRSITQHLYNSLKRFTKYFIHFTYVSLKASGYLLFSFYQKRYWLSMRLSVLPQANF